jgi:hypothetical protein
LDRVKGIIGTIFILSVTNLFGQVSVPDDIRHKIRPTFNLTDYRISGDTLTLVSTDKLLYYPFGVFDNVKKLKGQYQTLYKEKGGQSYLVNADSYVKFFYDDDKKAFEIVFARITNSNFKLTNGTKTGMTKKELFEKFFVTSPAILDKIKILELESALTGIWHYYQFDKDVLTSFRLDTDYQLDKN